FLVVSASILKKQTKVFKDNSEESEQDSLQKFMDYLIAVLTQDGYGVTSTMKESITRLALVYRKLSSESKIDLQRSFCIRNTLMWLNYDVNGE
ncbi:hypothetical protein PMAYCL1PPCAC_20860, partial [Pristionchus mayeri]